MYNGKYKQCIEIVIKSHSHEVCLDIAKHIKQLCSAWSITNVTFTEYKSAPKGKVHSRDILIYQNAYAHDIITFSESLRILAFHFGNNGLATVQFITRDVAPENSRADLTD